ncbi:MAG: di-heme oxidoredictase family protein [Gammaproteobacteria bacterium]
MKPPYLCALLAVTLSLIPGHVLGEGDGVERVKPRLASEALRQPVPGLTGEDGLRFRVGQALFERLWASAPASTRSADGLGPLYNARSCLQCHIRNGRGALPEAGSRTVVVKLSVPGNTGPTEAVLPEPVYGTQMQTRGTANQVEEGRLELRYTERLVGLEGGDWVSLRRPEQHLVELGYGPLDGDAMSSVRIAPPLVGMGLLDAVAEEDILAWADPGDHNGDGISGRPQRTWSRALSKEALGRFGHKAIHATLSDQNQSAFHEDLGLSVPLYPQAYGGCTTAQTLCLRGPHGDSPEHEGLEAGPRVVDEVLFYTRHLAVPARRMAIPVDSPGDSNERSIVDRGEALFHGSGCAACHRPSLRLAENYTTGESTGGLAGRIIHPYSDLLLHDMGEGLADERPEAKANGREWRTTPLWGLGYTGTVGPEAYLHDGRARTLLEAILWHDGEARASRDAVVALRSGDRDALITFLRSL